MRGRAAILAFGLALVPAAAWREVCVIGAKNLPYTDQLPKDPAPDPWVKVEVDGEELCHSEYIPNKQNPLWKRVKQNGQYSEPACCQVSESQADGYFWFSVFDAENVKWYGDYLGSSGFRLADVEGTFDLELQIDGKSAIDLPDADFFPLSGNDLKPDAWAKAREGVTPASAPPPPPAGASEGQIYVVSLFDEDALYGMSDYLGYAAVSVSSSDGERTPCEHTVAIEDGYGQGKLIVYIENQPASPEKYESGQTPGVPMAHYGEDCWDKCGGKGGPCPSFCGHRGACCRDGHQEEDCPVHDWQAPAGAAFTAGSCGSSRHCCVFRDSIEQAISEGRALIDNSRYVVHRRDVASAPSPPSSGWFSSWESERFRAVCFVRGVLEGAWGAGR
ncbi:hypothetical protein EMIHUDRAFT_199897 [Emiliania huxleyi CCMP1516]|uniref:C2 domain-containing protein n=2 Tax=Emiliania huxleyi TaxID=2903 RepID=A0A0D3KUK8_EMIH1|nr:hypothetical protein EMIHUDRAFT_199897 [Emiliania huxleyi CCMP1516]EOD39443.1 hypothetical protein EMIHUDRAFT_199897 [Emiliania huxleyi CCMP1516]|eukprot:XP_005791872.1 hypothetical protein EMIHUDRAFT_199897 [Emiliania huxleyi CCMP1516]